jgi:hypothetical protein
MARSTRPPATPEKSTPDRLGDPALRWTAPPRWPAAVDANAARLVAGASVVVAAVAIVTGAEAVVWALAGAFAFRAVAGPRREPLAVVASAVVRRWCAPALTAAAPKRFAAQVGATMSLIAALLVSVGLSAGWWVLGALATAAALEAVFGVCLACRVHAAGVAVGVVKDPCAVCSP